MDAIVVLQYATRAGAWDGAPMCLTDGRCNKSACSDTQWPAPIAGSYEEQPTSALAQRVIGVWDYLQAEGRHIAGVKWRKAILAVDAPGPLYSMTASDPTAEVAPSLRQCAAAEMHHSGPGRRPWRPATTPTAPAIR